MSWRASRRECGTPRLSGVERRAVRFSSAAEVVVDKEEHAHRARMMARLTNASGSETELLA